jgi:hypothetical protein
MSLRIRRGSDTQRQGITFDLGEPAWSSDSHKLYIGDAQTQGGINILASSAGAGLVWNPTTQQIDVDGASPALTTDLVTEGSINKYFTINSAIAATAQGLQNGTQSGIGFSYDSGANTISATVNINAVLPVQTGHDGQVLSTDGSGNLSWGAGLPSQSGNGGSVLTTNGTTASWASLLINTLTNGSYNVVLDSIGNLAVSGNISNVRNLSANTISATTGLGANLALNNFNINGTGNINITGNITVDNLHGIDTVKITPQSNTSSLTVSSNFNPALRASGITDGTLNNVARFELWASKGTIASPTSTNAGDSISSLQFRGYHSSSYVIAGGIISSWDANATFGSNFPASVLTMYAGNNAGNVKTVSFSGLTGVFLVPVLRLTVYSVAGTPLPTADSVGAGARSFVNDATVNTFGSAYVGSGPYSVPVYSDGTNWFIG